MDMPVYLRAIATELSEQSEHHAALLALLPEEGKP
jgi:hypothetical protein